MLRTVAYFEGSDLAKPIELTGISKRINSIGLQPIPGDQFRYEDLIKEDKDKIEKLVGKPSIRNVVVKSRQFKFENTYAAIYIMLGPD
ncbi:MAG: hypothetical protein HY015_01075 [Bacteroidetes bacterium]|nr:hypothetical protein [Bacteroidota bacterium]MBI3481570.1 hypothetical protein [Bacteroidota bacterium]